MGAVHIDPSGNWGKKDSIIQPGLVYDAGLFEYAAYTCGANLNIFTPWQLHLFSRDSVFRWTRAT